MPPAPSDWCLALARIEGALPFLSAHIAQCLAQRSLRRLWAVHIRDFPFENMGLEHNPGLDAGELMRSWQAEERRDFLSWVSRRGPPPLAQAARLALTAKAASESFASGYQSADRALERLDALLPTSDPVATLVEMVGQLRTDEIEFLEGGSEVHAFAGATFDRPAPKGAAWAASLAVAMRPQLFGLGAAPLALAGLIPRSVFRPEPEDPIPALLGSAVATAARWAQDDLESLHKGLAHGLERLAGRYASSHAPAAWALLLGLGPLTRAELARVLKVTPRTASQVALALEQAGLIVPPALERPLQPALQRR
jgi:hypothetical protein